MPFDTRMLQPPRSVRSLFLAGAAISLALAGCASVPRIDPSGERILTWGQEPAAISATPGVVLPATVAPGLTLTPTRIVAPVGSEVLMVAGVHGPGQANLVGQRVEWMLSPGSVGQLLAVGESEQSRLWRFSTPPQKVSNDYAVSETQSTPRIITRGTVDPRDDVSVLPGQAWVTVASPVEGSSYVTAFAPDIQGVISNRQSAVIHWVDVRWISPASAAVGIGDKHSLVTSVLQASTGAPVAGYKVRYEVAGGVEAGFGPSLSGGVELTTNDQGQAGAELTQSTPQPGATQVNVQLVRPAGIVPGVSESLVLGSTTIAVNWSDGGGATVVSPAPSSGSPLPGAPSIPPATAPPATVPPPQTTPPSARPNLDVRIVSPSQSVLVGDQAEFQIHITNRSTAA